MNHSVILRIMLDEVGGQMQGAAVPFFNGSGLAKGVNRMAFAPDHSLWAGHTKRDGGWAGSTGLQRITWNGTAPMDVKTMKLTKDGFDLAFTHSIKAPIDSAESFRFRRYFYEYHRAYGSKQYDVKSVAVAKTTMSSDRKSVSLTLSETMKAGYVYELVLKGITNDDGEAIVNTYLVYNVNRLVDGTSAMPQFEGNFVAAKPEKKSKRPSRPVKPVAPMKPVAFDGEPILVEAEDASVSGARNARKNRGFTGQGYVDFNGSTGESIEWRIDSSRAVPVELSFVYALDKNSRPVRLIVNGKVQKQPVPFTSTGGWGVWKPVVMKAVFKKGVNTVRLESFGNSGPNVDSLKVRHLP
jgi:hypothetical protein